MAHVRQRKTLVHETTAPLDLDIKYEFKVTVPGRASHLSAIILMVPPNENHSPIMTKGRSKSRQCPYYPKGFPKVNLNTMARWKERRRLVYKTGSINHASVQQAPICHHPSITTVPIFNRLIYHGQRAMQVSPQNVCNQKDRRMLG
ncbi:hypothetical protein TWF506_004554 [Arthrobotrys conoides]|uniref:Uncharacterized protein n=1 Tax=Arthrobotrys conoides TaxID=74498 RepID=A0AAN8N652_9PEZI